MDAKKISISPLGTAALTSGLFADGSSDFGSHLNGATASVKFRADQAKNAALTHRISPRLSDALTRLTAALSNHVNVDGAFILGPAFSLAKLEPDGVNSAAILFLVAAILVEESGGGSCIFLGGNPSDNLEMRLRNLGAAPDEIQRCEDLVKKVSPCLIEQWSTSTNQETRAIRHRLAALPKPCTLGFWSASEGQNRRRFPLVVEAVGKDNGSDVWLLALERTRCREETLAGRLANRIRHSVRSDIWKPEKIPGVSPKVNREQLAAIRLVLAALRQVCPSEFRRRNSKVDLNDQSGGDLIEACDGDDYSGVVLEGKSGSLTSIYSSKNGEKKSASSEDSENGGLVIITGGPGTGKTFTVAQILRAIWNDPALNAWLIQGNQVRFTAPTGKAADRMDESIKTAFSGGQDGGADGAIRNWVSTSEISPKTIHRLLGANPRRGTFHFHENKPLKVGLVIADEVSMVGVAMMDRLVKAVPPGAVLVLLGDDNQLPSVEAGAVLRDLCRLDRHLRSVKIESSEHHLSDKNSKLETSVKKTKSVTAEICPEGSAEDSNFPKFRVHLVESKRQSGNAAGQRIILSAKFINEGRIPVERDAEGNEVMPCRRCVSEVSGVDVASGMKLPEKEVKERLEFLGAERLPLNLQEALCRRWGSKIHEGVGRRTGRSLIELVSTSYFLRKDGTFSADQMMALEDAFDLVQRQVVLCATRVQTAWMNAVLHSSHLEFLNRFKGRSRTLSGRFVPGEPVLMSRNDEAKGIFNGDQGIIFRIRIPGEPQRFYVLFRKAGGFKSFLLGELSDDLEMAFAMTVHKSQGSEYQDVLLLLPRSEANPLLTREIIYTAVTRAKKSVVICGEADCLKCGVERVVNRNSALLERVLSWENKNAVKFV